MKSHNPEDTGLCPAIQPDGRHQRCIRFGDHSGPHQTFVAEWGEGEPCSRRRQTREPGATAAPAALRQPFRHRLRMRARWKRGGAAAD